jgi:hypothetical protein
MIGSGARPRFHKEDASVSADAIVDETDPYASGRFDSQTGLNTRHVKKSSIHL